MNKEKLLKKVAEMGKKTAVKASGKSSLYLMYQPKEPECLCVYDNKKCR